MGLPRYKLQQKQSQSKQESDKYRIFGFKFRTQVKIQGDNTRLKTAGSGEPAYLRGRCSRGRVAPLSRRAAVAAIPFPIRLGAIHENQKTPASDGIFRVNGGSAI
ncbi:hypothetical protein D3C84_837290 [compost metagenome]